MHSDENARPDYEYQPMSRVYTLDEARARVAYWQQRLQLTEWTIVVSLVRQHAFNDTNYLLGQVAVLRNKQIAVIKLLDPIDFFVDSGFIDKHDMELTIVHELLHIRMDGINADAAAVRELSEERAAHALSKTLVTLDRGLGCV